MAPPSAAVFGTMVLSLWVNASRVDFVTLEGTFHEFLGGGWLNTTSTDRKMVDTMTKAVNFTYPLSQPLVLGARLSVSVRLASSANVTMFWGALSNPSYVILPMSGYIALNTSRGPISILDGGSQTPSNSFDLNSTNRLIIFEAFLDSALGFEDIGRLNMTLVDPGGKPVRHATNLPMSLFQFTSPYGFTTTWPYPSNATAGIYQIYLDIFDFQDNRVFSFRGPLTFRLLSPNLFSGPPFNYLPYFGIGGAVIVGGVLYYRRRKTKKSYLVPFDHFNTLTGGELDGGSVVAVEGNTGAGKTLLSEQLMFEDLKKGRPCVFVATGDFPSNIRANMKAMGLDITGYEQSGLVTFVDGYSAEAGQESREKFVIPSLGDLTTLGIKISSSLPPESFKGGSLYFDSLTPLASKTKPESIVSFVQSLGARVKGMGGRAFFTVGPSVDGMVQRQLEDMADCVVQMEAFEESGVRKSRLRIAKYRARRHQQGWVIYTIEEGKGIIFYSRKPRQ